MLNSNQNFNSPMERKSKTDFPIYGYSLQLAVSLRQKLADGTLSWGLFNGENVPIHFWVNMNSLLFDYKIGLIHVPSMCVQLHIYIWLYTRVVGSQCSQPRIECDLLHFRIDGSRCSNVCHSIHILYIIRTALDYYYLKWCLSRPQSIQFHSVRTSSHPPINVGALFVYSRGCHLAIDFIGHSFIIIYDLWLHFECVPCTRMPVCQMTSINN